MTFRYKSLHLLDSRLFFLDSLRIAKTLTKKKKFEKEKVRLSLECVPKIPCASAPGCTRVVTPRLRVAADIKVIGAGGGGATISSQPSHAAAKFRNCSVL